MITKQPVEGKALELWNRVIERANEATGRDPVISTIDDLFDHMATVLAYEKSNVEQGTPNFQPIALLSLPTDEDLFEIDANTRKITVPASFANGIGVQGDEIAEIIYFSIDRYFDTIDLYDQNIYIQYQIPTSGTEPTPMAYPIPDYLKSWAIKEGKIIFGWPITSEFTETAGNIQFSVRFFQRGTDSQGRPILTYSFSTLTSTVKVNPGLNFDIVDEESMTTILVDKNQMIFDRLEPSVNAAATPIFVLPNEPMEARVDEEVYAQAEFKASARNKGEISYEWLYTSAPGIPAIKKVDTPKYVESDDKTRNPSKVYYQENDGEHTVYTGDFYDGIKLYERKASLIIDAIGTYQAKAINTVKQQGVKAAESVSKIYSVLAPKEPVVEQLPTNLKITTDASLTVNASTDDGGELKYQWYKKPLTQNESEYTIVENETGASLEKLEEGIYCVEVSNEKNKVAATVKSSECLVAEPASKFTIKLTVNGEEIPSENDIPVGTTLTAVPVYEEGVVEKSQEYVYEWKEGSTIVGTNNSYTLEKNETRYTVKITNKYYTDEESVELRIYCANA